MLSVRATLRVFRDAGVSWWHDDVIRLGASLSYYTLFAIAPILVVAIAIAGLVFGPAAVQGHVVDQIRGLIGQTGAEAVQSLLQGIHHRHAGKLATIVGTAVFLITASTAFIELQTDLNRIFRVEADPAVPIRLFVFNRLQAFALMIALGFLLLVSLAVSAALAALGEWVGAHPIGDIALWQWLTVVIGYLVIFVLFGLLFKVLPDVRLHWRDVAVGAGFTALLFTGGKELIGLYLGRGSVASSYGAAASVIVLLIWVYYASQILLFGAEFVRVYAEHRLGHPVPSRLGKRVHPKPAGTEDARVEGTK